MDYLEGLNANQREAAQTIEGPLLIIAGPGSGKTRVITHRIAHLVKTCGVNPRRVLAVTFTNKAAKEMRLRLARLLGQGQQDVTLGTFHSICARLLRIEGENIGLDRGFAIYDDADQMWAVKQALEDLNLDQKKIAPRACLNFISAAKSQLIKPEINSANLKMPFEEAANRVYQRYEQLLGESKALDFDDLLTKTVLMFNEHPEILEKYQERYLHVLVDEFQDTSPSQYQLVRMLAAKHRNICVVGDPDQSIYSWRQADIRNILNFEKDYPEAKVVTLEQNYRSTKTILEAAASMISANKQRKPKELWTDNEAGQAILVVEAYNEKEEAQFVVREIEVLTKRKTFEPGDIAVMYRTNAQSRALEEAFLRHGVPYRLVGGLRFYERKEVKDALAYLRLIQNPFDSASMARVINVPTRGIGDRSVEELSKWAHSLNIPPYAALQLLSNAEAPSKPEDKPESPFNARTEQALAGFLSLINGLIEKSKNMDIVQLFDTLMKDTGYKSYLEEDEEGETKWENIQELRTVAAEYKMMMPEEGLQSFLENVALVSDVDDMDKGGEAVTLITLHLAKGLEYPVVFIIGLEEGLLPHQRAIDGDNESHDEMEEERRLFYVGMTRAGKRLYLIRAFRRAFRGMTGANQPSRFLYDIPRSLITTPAQAEKQARLNLSPQAQYPQPQRLAWGGNAPSKEAKPTPDYKAGDHVKHAAFGEGVVVNCIPNGQDYEVTVAFKGTAGVKRLLLSYAPLEKVV